MTTDLQARVTALESAIRQHQHDVHSDPTPEETRAAVERLDAVLPTRVPVSDLRALAEREGS